MTGINMIYTQEEAEIDPCGKCGGLLMGRTTEEEDAEGYRSVQMRCVACGDKTTDRFDAHLGCNNWPNCNMYGCGND